MNKVNTPSFFKTSTTQYASFFACLFFAIAVQFRTQLISNFWVLYGDSYDATIVATILEHWSNVFRGLSHWSELNYFFPHTKTLGQTDGYFLAGLIYAPIRMLGLDPYLSSELSNVALRAIGFFSFFLLSKRAFNLTHGWALLAATLFILSNNLTIHGQRLQLATVSLAPLMALLLWQLYSALQSEDRNQLYLYGALSGIFLGAWSITCFYITWFFIYFTTFFLIAAFLCASDESRRVFFQQCKLLWRPLCTTAIITALSLYPLLSVYLAKAAETGMRPYESALSNTVPWQGILQVGHENFMFGEIYNKLLAWISPGYVPSGEYYNTGIAPVLFVVFIGGLYHIFRSRKTPSIWLPLAIATIITWAGVLSFRGYSGWFILYHIFPGAKALNVIGAYQLFISIPVILIAVRYLQSNTLKVSHLIIALVVSLLCLEELNQGYTHLNRMQELEKVSVLHPHPDHCTAFYVSGWANQDTLTPMAVWINNFYAHNVTAMLIAELIHLPTLNGVASFNPKDWDFGFPNNADYDQRVRNYADRYQLTNICKFDLQTREWSVKW